MRVGILVPLRDQRPVFDRHHQLRQLRATLERRIPGAHCVMVVVEQHCEDPRRFNRGALLNAAFALLPSNPPCDVVIFHDVDLLPCDVLAPQYLDPLPRGVVRHLGARWPRYAKDCAQYLGGVTAVHPHDFVAIDGFPSTFWGWGGEDDALRVRLAQHGIRIERATRGYYRDLERMNLPAKLELLRCTQAKCPDKWEQLDEERAGRPRPGLRRVRFSVLDSNVSGGALPLHHFCVALHDDDDA